MANSRGTKSLKNIWFGGWLARGDLKRETEALLVAAPDQALNTVNPEGNISYSNLI